MKLTQDQQKMLDGGYGEGAQLAMKIQFAIGEAFDAERMVPITRAHIALCNQPADIWFAEKMRDAGAKFRIPATVNPGFCLSYFTEKGMADEEAQDMMRRTDEAYRDLGAVLSYNCTPYLDTNVPHFGEIISFSESSATPYVNSIWGARSNREGANSALCAAITGYVPEYGLLLDENRYGDIVVDVQAKMETPYDYHLLGMMGKKIGKGVPVFINLPEYVSPESLRNLGAQLNTSGAYGMFHIVGFTPEAPDLETALGNKKPDRTVVITDKDLEDILEEISLEGDREIDFAMFGCPHFTLNEVAYIRERINGRKLAKPMWILTSSHVLEMAKRMGYYDELEKLGAHIVPDTCPDQLCWKIYDGKIGITESPKCAYYPQRRGMYFVIRDLDTCVESAISGRVEK